MKTYKKILIFISIFMIPISIALFHILQEGIPTAFNSNKTHLDTILSEVAKNMEEKNKIRIKKTILIPLPDQGFDAAETAVPWKIFKEFYGFDVKFATEKGLKAKTDMISLRGEGLDSIMSFLFNIFPLKHPEEVRNAYKELENDSDFKNPLSWDKINLLNYDAIWIPGGHAQGMKQLLDNSIIHTKLLEYWQAKKPVSAVCHGVILLARTLDKNGKSILYHKKSTSVANYMERLAQLITSWRMGNYFRTYEESTEDEVKRAIYGVTDINEAKKLNKDKMLYDTGSISLDKPSIANPFQGAFIVEDENYISGRWPGDVNLLAHRLAQKTLIN